MLVLENHNVKNYLNYTFEKIILFMCPIQIEKFHVTLIYCEPEDLFTQKPYNLDNF